MNWRDDAACGGADLLRFGSDIGYSRALCEQCPVVVECLAETLAVDSGEYAAGMTGATRRQVGPRGMAREVAALVSSDSLRRALDAAVWRIATGDLSRDLPTLRPDAVARVGSGGARSWKREAVAAEWRKRLADSVWLSADESKPLGECTAQDLWGAADLHRRQSAALEALANLLYERGALTVAHLDDETLHAALTDSETVALPSGSGRTPETEPRQGDANTGPQAEGRGSAVSLPCPALPAARLDETPPTPPPAAVVAPSSTGQAQRVEAQP